MINIYVHRLFVFFPPIQHLAESLLHSILSELKSQKMSVEHTYIHALCRVYVGVCRQLGDLERARLFCYGLLKEGTCGWWRSSLRSRGLLFYLLTRASGFPAELLLCVFCASPWFAVGGFAAGGFM